MLVRHNGAMKRLYTNGTIWTGIWRDGKVLTCDSVTQASGRVVALGAAAEELPADEVVDLDGGFLMPGFADGHAHPLKGGVAALFAPVTQETSVAGILHAVARWAQDHPDEPWVRGEGYDPALAPGGIFDRVWLDEAVADRPVALRAADYHTMWANSLALALAGIDEHTPDPPRGVIERNPMGTLREWGAWRLVDQCLPRLTQAQRRSAARYAMDYLTAHGITFVQDAWVEPDDVATWEAAVETEATVRVDMALLAEPERWRDQLSWFVDVQQSGDDRLTANAIKFFADGVIESGTAHMLEPYCGCGGRGIPNWTREELAAAVTSVVGLGFQPHVHAIGDAGVRSALDACAAAARIHGHAGHPVIAHCQVIDPRDVPRFAALGVTANFEPLWARLDADQDLLTQPRLGPERSSRQYQMASLLRAGANVSFGSDWPITSGNPLAGISVAVSRQMPDGTPKGGWLPEERMTVDQALSAYTAGVAQQVGAKDWGTLAPGNRAEFAWLAQDPRTVAPLDLADIEIRTLPR